jgi:hypothetical protein
MTLHEVEIDELGLWKPRSGFFQHQYRKQRARLMVQQQPAEHGARLAFCTYCQSGYLASDAVPNSPCHDAPPALMYDLEALVNAASVVEALAAAIGADTPEALMRSIEVLAGLANGMPAGVGGEPSQEPSTAADSPLPASEQDGRRLTSVASVEGSSGLAGADTPAAVPGAEGGEGSSGGDSVSPRRPGRARRAAATAAAS